MLSLKLTIRLMALTFFFTAARTASTRRLASNNHVAELYVKDDSNGELRFLGSTSNAQINQLITQKQDMLEQLRPTSTSSGSGAGAVAGSGLVTTSSAPIIINTGGSAVNNGVAASAIPGSSPIGALLPQIVAQSVAGGRRTVGGQRRRVIGNRRVVNNRRRHRPVTNNRAQIFVVRPRN